MLRKKKIKFYSLIRTKIITLVIFSVILTLAISTIAFVSKSGSIMNRLMKNYMKDAVTYMGGNLERDVELLGRSALSVDSLDKKLSGYKLSGMASSYTYIVDSTGYVLYHPSSDEIGKPIQIDAVKALQSKLGSGNPLAPDTMEYQYDGINQYAAYYVSTDESYILILTANKEDAMSEINGLTHVILLLSLIPLFICSVVAVIISMMISKPIEKTVERIDRLSELDLNSEIGAAKFKGEVGLINSSVDSFKKKLVSTIQNIKRASDVVDINADNITSIAVDCFHTAENISSTVGDLAKGATEMAQNTESTMRGIENIGNSIDDIKDVTNQSLSIVTEATTIGNHSKESLDKLMVANADTKKSAEDVSDGIFEINQTVDEIHKAADMIQSIASKTNLLSLNASIEAAREIAMIVQQITSLVDTSVQTAQSIRDASDHEGTVLQDVSASFEAVNGKFDEIAKAVHTIVDRVDSVNAEKVDIMNAISNLSAISEENAASTQETSASIQLLVDRMQSVTDNSNESKQTTGGLKDMISVFKV